MIQFFNVSKCAAIHVLKLNADNLECMFYKFCQFFFFLNLF